MSFEEITPEFLSSLFEDVNILKKKSYEDVK